MFKHIFVSDPKKLMQGIDVTYARYMYYIEIGKSIDVSKYRMLFISQKNFLNYMVLKKKT